MTPSYMELKIVQVVGYNKIVIITDKQTLGVNSDINTVLITHPSTGETGIVKQEASAVIQPNTEVTSQPRSVIEQTPHIVTQNQQHIDEKTTLRLGGIAAGLFMIWINSFD